MDEKTFDTFLQITRKGEKEREAAIMRIYTLVYAPLGISLEEAKLAFNVGWKFEVEIKS